MPGYKTLGEIIATRDFDGREVHDCHYYLDADDIEEMLYANSYGDYNVRTKHEEAFFENERLTKVAINTWICTDQYVGLELLCLNDEPVAIRWRTGRKSNGETAFVSEDASAKLRNAWEKYRPASGLTGNIITHDMLAMPVAAAGDEAFHIDECKPAADLALSAAGVMEWLAAIAPQEEGESDNDWLSRATSLMDDIPAIRHALEAGRNEIIEQQHRADDYTEKMKTAERGFLDLVTAEIDKATQRIVVINAAIITPFEQRLAALEAE